MLGEVVGNYVIEAKLAEGGMGAVYRATHKLLAKPAAVKVLRPELSTNLDVVQRFFTEARAATTIRHPGIVEIYDFGHLSGGVAYITMELLDGEPLSDRLVSAGRLDEGTALQLLRGIASALDAAHAHGIIHRDLKPDNVFLVPDPDMPLGVRPKLLDFGIAKVAEAARAGEATRTRTGSLIGTPIYMSPEQCRGAGDVDHRSDIYSLGCLLYEMVTGQPPFNGEGLGEIIGAHLHTPPVPPTKLVAEISANLERLILCLLAKRPEERVQSAAELVRILGAGTAPTIVMPAGPSAVRSTVVAQPGNGTMVIGEPPRGPTVVVPTTLSGTAGEAVTPPRAGRPVSWLLAAGLLATACAAAFVAVRHYQDDAEQPASAALSAADTDAAPASAPDAGSIAPSHASIADAGVPPVTDAGEPVDAAPDARVPRRRGRPPTGTGPHDKKTNSKETTHETQTPPGDKGDSAPVPFDVGDVGRGD